jgi:light-regulated signal transduction histidine kinase (bacteriophytochrome)
MSLPILCEGKLWGLIACHHHQPRVPPHHVRNTLRSICELVAEVSAMRIETLSQLATAQNALLLDQLLVKVHQAVLQDANIKAVLGHLLPDLLTAFHASALCVAIGDLKYVGGRTHSPTAQRTSYSLDRRGMSRCESPLRGRMRGRPAPAHAV